MTDAGNQPIGNGNPPTGLPVLGTVGTLVGGVGSGVAPTPFANLLTSIVRTSNGSSVDLLISALETKGLVRRLAEPNLSLFPETPPASWPVANFRCRYHPAPRGQLSHHFDRIQEIRR